MFETRKENEQVNLERKKALVISVADYIESDKLVPLDFCKKDGERMYEVLKALGYEIEENRKLVGHVKFDIMRDAIYDFFDNSQTLASDTLIFYYSGHGIPIPGSNMCLASSETDPNNPKKRGFTSYDLTELIENSNSIRIVEILDCCYSGANKVSKGDQDAAAKLGGDAIERLQQGEGKCLLAASQAAQEAFGLKEKGHSIFTYYLIEGLTGNQESVDEQGNVTPHSLGKYVYQSILNLAQNKRPRQKPITKTEASGDIILANYPHLAKKVPSTDISFINEGTDYLMDEEFESALTSFNKAISINPDNPVPYYRIGQLLFQQSMYQPAIESFEKAILLNPNHQVPYKLKGDVYFKLGKYQDAIECYDRSLVIKPKYKEALYSKVDALLHIGKELLKQEKYNEAKSCYDEIIRIEPNNMEANKNMNMIIYAIQSSNNKDVTRSMNLVNQNAEFTTIESRYEQSTRNNGKEVMEFEEKLGKLMHQLKSKTNDLLLGNLSEDDVWLAIGEVAKKVREHRNLIDEETMDLLERKMIHMSTDRAKLNQAQNIGLQEEERRCRISFRVSIYDYTNLINGLLESHNNKYAIRSTNLTDSTEYTSIEEFREELSKLIDHLKLKYEDVIMNKSYAYELMPFIINVKEKISKGIRFINNKKNIQDLGNIVIDLSVLKREILNADALGDDSKRTDLTIEFLGLVNKYIVRLIDLNT